mgnify:CR=1 FL=1
MSILMINAICMVSYLPQRAMKTVLRSDLLLIWILFLISVITRSTRCLRRIIMEKLFLLEIVVWFLIRKFFPHLSSLKGRTLITSDGTTILGADDKAGIAEILTMVERLVSKQIPHGPISIAFYSR